MNQSQILVNLSVDANTTTKEFAARLAKMWMAVKELKCLPGYEVQLGATTGNVQLVQAMPVLRRDDFTWSGKSGYEKACSAQDRLKELYGEFPIWQTVVLKHQAGSYSVNLPAENDFYYTFLSFAGMQIESKPKQIEASGTDGIILPSEIFKAVLRATKFTVKDDLRPVFQHVCIIIENGSAEVVATDAHRMFISKKYECSQIERKELFFSVAAAKELSKLKLPELVEVTADRTSVTVNGRIYQALQDMRFPNYKVVIPEHENFIEFDRAGFVNNIKAVLPAANKSTNLLALHLNGSIAIAASDIDFATESNSELPYITKNFEELDIAFNGKFLIDALGSFKEKALKMYVGKANQAGLITNGEDTALLMPLMNSN